MEWDFLLLTQSNDTCSFYKFVRLEAYSGSSVFAIFHLREDVWPPVLIHTLTIKSF